MSDWWVIWGWEEGVDACNMMVFSLSLALKGFYKYSYYSIPISHKFAHTEGWRQENSANVRE